MALPRKPGEVRTHDDYGHFLMIDGQLAGTWRRNETKTAIEVAVSPYRRLTRPQAQALAATARRFEAFAERPVTCRTQP